MGDENRSINISGGIFDNSNVAGGDITVVRNSPKATVSSPSVTARDLRMKLDDHRAEIVGLAGDKSKRAGRALDDLDEELAGKEPDTGFVRERWTFVESLLAGGAKAAESISTIAAMVRTLTGT